MLAEILRRVYWRFVPDSGQDIFHFFFSNALPSGLRVRISRLSKANYYQRVFSERGVIFIHIPRAAGTSVCRAIYGENNIGHLTVRGFKQNNPRLFENLFTFSITRNPWDRLVSAFEFARQGGGSDIRMSFPRKYATWREKEFSDFVRMLADFDLNKMDPVFRPQCHFLFDNNNRVNLNYLGKMESIRDVEKKLTEILDVRIFFAEISNASVRRGYRDYYKDDRTIELVARLYEDDVNLQGYEFDG